MPSLNSLVVIGKPVTGEMVDTWLSVDDMVGVIGEAELVPKGLRGNSSLYEEVCFDIDCRDVAGILLLEHDENSVELPDLRYRQFPVNSGTWAERDGQFCICPCFGIVDECCPEPEEEDCPETSCEIDWCAEWRRLWKLKKQYQEPFVQSLEEDGRKISWASMSDKAKDCFNAELRQADAKCKACRGVRTAARSIFRRVRVK